MGGSTMKSTYLLFGGLLTALMLFGWMQSRITVLEARLQELESISQEAAAHTQSLLQKVLDQKNAAGPSKGRASARVAEEEEEDDGASFPKADDEFNIRMPTRAVLSADDGIKLVPLS